MSHHMPRNEQRHEQQHDANPVPKSEEPVQRVNSSRTARAHIRHTSVNGAAAAVRGIGSSSASLGDASAFMSRNAGRYGSCLF